MTYAGTLAMPTSYAVMDSNEMTYVEGGRTKTYYNKAGTLANTFHVCKVAFEAQNLIYASAMSGLPVSGGITALICSHNAEMYGRGESLCRKYSHDTYVTATVEYDNFVYISSVKVRKGK